MGTNLKLIVSDEKKPKVALQAGMKLEVVGVSLVTAQLKPARGIAARLCDGGGTCVALVETGTQVKSKNK